MKYSSYCPPEFFSCDAFISKPVDFSKLIDENKYENKNKSPCFSPECCQKSQRQFPWMIVIDGNRTQSCFGRQTESWPKSYSKLFFWLSDRAMTKVILKLFWSSDRAMTKVILKLFWSSDRAMTKVILKLFWSSDQAKTEVILKIVLWPKAFSKSYRPNIELLLVDTFVSKQCAGRIWIHGSWQNQRRKSLVVHSWYIRK